MTDNNDGYGQYCPISRALDVLGERWSLLILRDLYLGTTRFNDLARGLPGLSRSLLAKRLRQFERAGLLDKVGTDHQLTAAGRDLEPILFGLGEWGARWTFGPSRAEERDPGLLVWWMRDRVDTSSFPGLRHVLHVRFTDDIRRYWIVVERGIASVCDSDPGYPVDVTITAAVATLYEIWLGRVPLVHAQRAGRISFHGDPALTRRMPAVLRLSPVAGYVRAATEEARPARAS
ncbi:winged helix-turn-helix transcriptional regulator [Nocardia thailandica]|uniref:Winged helix-turn-helix transcriptional regulator n=1 Tax=Nocardia thailandica TaxID=257275 RepID=A0ABW6PMA8_9NOCA